MVQGRVTAKKAILFALSALLLLPSIVDAQAWRRPPVRSSPPISRPLPPRPIPPRPPVRPPLPGGMRSGPLIKPPAMPQGGFRPSGSGAIGRPSSVTIRPTTLPRPGSGISRPAGGGIAIKPGANVSLNPRAPTNVLTARLKGSNSRGGALAAGRPSLRGDPRIIQAKRLAAAGRPTAASIQRVRAELRKPGKALAPVQCAAVGSCPPQKGKYYQKAKLGQSSDYSSNLAATQRQRQQERPYLKQWAKNDPFKLKLSVSQRHYISEQITSNPHAGKEIMTTFRDSSYSTGGWVKRQIEIPLETGTHKDNTSNNYKALIHYMHNPSTGRVEQIKLKAASNSPVKP